VAKRSGGRRRQPSAGLRTNRFGARPRAVDFAGCGYLWILAATCARGGGGRGEAVEDTSALGVDG
jgi:hypothetical protein